MFGSFFSSGRLLHPASAACTGTSYFPYIFYGFAGVSGVIWFPRQYSQPDYLLWKTQNKLIKSVVFGSLLALVILSLLALCDGNIRAKTKAIISSGGNVDSPGEIVPRREQRHYRVCLLVFSNLAVASSFFGVTLGLFDYLADLFKIDNSHGGRFKTVLLTFLPPALLSIPNGSTHAGSTGAGCAPPSGRWYSRSAQSKLAEVSQSKMFTV